MELQNKIGLGSVQFGIPYGISNQNGQTPFDEVAKILDFAFSSNIKIIDTASGYGTSESVIGELNKSRFEIVSKFMPSNSEVDIRKQLEKSLSLLKIESLYGYLAHRPLDLLDNIVVWNELKKLKSEMKIKKIGFSLNTPEEYYQLKLAGLEPDLVQVPFNYFDTRFKEVLIELKNAGCEVHTRSTFLQGLFFADTEKLPAFFNELKPSIKNLQNNYNEELEVVLLSYVLQQEFIDIVIMGVENEGQLKKNINCIDNASQLESLKITFSEQVVMPMHWPKN
jgi:aryl-alcohol dehydrogenase-like predicted oxidoreductase